MHALDVNKRILCAQDGLLLGNYGRSGAWTESLGVLAPLQEMMLQSWDGALRILPAWPLCQPWGLGGAGVRRKSAGAGRLRRTGRESRAEGVLRAGARARLCRISQCRIRRGRCRIGRGPGEGRAEEARGGGKGQPGVGRGAETPRPHW